MTAARALQIDDWVVHRHNVVRSVAARVPGIDAEEATSRALEKMVRIVSTGGTINDPAPYWRRAAVNEAISMTREAGRTHAVEDDTLDGLAPPVEGAELDAERQADVAMLREALSDMADEDRKILFERHVHDRAVTEIADDLGVRPHAVTMRLRRAEERLAGAFAAAHAHTVNEPECRTTRAAMHDYLKDRLLPRRRGRVEAHMDGCAECTRAFVDVREVSWMLRDLGQHLVAGAVATGALGGLAGAAGAGAAAGGAAGAGSAGGAGGAAQPPRFGKKEAAIAAAVLAALALGGGAVAYVANQPDAPVSQAVQDAGGSGAGDGGAAGGGADDGPAGSGAGGGGAGGGDTPRTGPETGGEGDSGAGSTAGSGAADGGSANRPANEGTAPSDSADARVGRPPGGAEGGGNPADGSAAEGSPRAAQGGAPEHSSGGEPATADDPGISDDVASWFAWLGGSGDMSGEAPGAGTTPGTVTSDEIPSGRAPSTTERAGPDDTGRTTDPGSGAAAGTGPSTADGARSGPGAELTGWFARLGIAGVPAFLLVVLVLWLWERWTRAAD